MGNPLESLEKSLRVLDPGSESAYGNFKNCTNITKEYKNNKRNFRKIEKFLENLFFRADQGKEFDVWGILNFNFSPAKFSVLRNKQENYFFYENLETITIFQLEP